LAFDRHSFLHGWQCRAVLCRAMLCRALPCRVCWSTLMISEAGMLHFSFITRTGALQRELDELMTSSIDAQDEKGRTPLMRAVLCDDVTVALQMCTLLLQVRLQCAAVTHHGTLNPLQNTPIA
jgi:hypothetical protein